jgi:hypothetical protein
MNPMPETPLYFARACINELDVCGQKEDGYGHMFIMTRRGMVHGEAKKVQAHQRESYSQVL